MSTISAYCLLSVKCKIMLRSVTWISKPRWHCVIFNITLHSAYTPLYLKFKAFLKLVINDRKHKCVLLT